MLGKYVECLIPQRGVASEVRGGLRAEPQPEAEPTFWRDELLHSHRVFADGREILRPGFSGVDIQAVGEVERRLMLEDHVVRGDRLSRLQAVQTAFHERQVNLVHLEACADSLRESDAQLAAEVLAEVAQAGENLQPSCGVARECLSVPEREAA